MSTVDPAPAPLGVFISYSSADKPIADAACGVLEARGIRCWIAPRDLAPGEEWSAGIIRGLERCRLMVLVFSGEADKSRQVIREVERAVNKNIGIIPFRIENVTPTGGMEYFLNVPHWLDAYVPPLDGHLDRLADTAAAHLASLPPPAPPPGKGVRGLVRKAGRAMLARDNRARVLVGLLLAVLLSVGLYYVAGLMLKDPTADDATIAAKAEAEQLAGRVAALDRGQGFGEKIDAVGVTVRSAAAAFDQKKFADALTGYRAAGTQARDVLAEDDRRTRDRLAEQERNAKAKAVLDKARADAEAARDRADKARAAGAEAKATEQPGWAGALELAEQAAAEYRAADYARAETLWKQATAEFTRAAGGKALTAAKAKFEAELARVNVPHMQKLTPDLWKPVLDKKAEAEAAEKKDDPALAAAKYTEAYPLARVATLPMRRYAAFWLGMHCRFKHRVMELESVGVKPDPKHRELLDWYISRYRREESRALGLGLEATQFLELQRNIDGEKQLRDANARVTGELPDLLAKSHEPDVAASFRAGNNTALLVLFPIHSFGKSYSPRMPGVKSTATAVAKAVVRMREAGWPDSLVERYDDIRELLFAEAADVERWNTPPRVDDEPADETVRGWIKKIEAAIDPLGSPRTALPLFARPLRLVGAKPSPAAEWANRLSGGCRFEGRDPDRAVTGIDMTGRELKDGDLAEIGMETAISSIRIGYTAVSGAGLRNLSGMAELTELHARSIGLTDDDGPAVAPFKKLKVLLLGGTKVGDKFAQTLAELKELRELDLSNTAVTDAALPHLAKLKHLAGLNLRGTKVTKEGLAKFKKDNPKIEVVE